MNSVTVTVRQQIVKQGNASEIEKRKKLTADFIEEKSLIIQEKFLNSELYRASENICCYIDFRNEVKTDMLIQKALEDEKNVYIPKIFSDNTMEFFQIDFKTEYYNKLDWNS